MLAGCLGDDTIVDYVGHALEQDRVADVERHLAACDACRRLVSEAVRVGVCTALHDLRRSAHDSREPLEACLRGSLIGRYVVLGVVGRGGMGVVYRAFDPDLNRQIALKVVGFAAIARDAREEARQRLLHEARALAKLSHPNVVAVHDVGAFRDDVFVAMELVQGRTLRTWLAKAARTPREILDVFVGAAKGLAAAHRVGVVHRDFKPDNVMVGDDGSVRVLDFGLARISRFASRASVPVIAPPIEPVLTNVGKVVGTPAYMSPEQDAGTEITPASDQFSLCVALHEALYGALPFVGATYAELVELRATGAFASPPKRRGVPARIRQALAIGLRTDPAERHSTLDALIGELEDRPWRSWRLLAAAVATALALGIAISWLARGPADDPTATCRVVANQIDAMWNARTRAEMIRGFAVSGHPRAAAIAAEAIGKLDRWTADWAAARREVCESSLQASPGAAERLPCLERRATDLDSVIAMFTVEPDFDTVDRADEGLGQLGRVSDCAPRVTALPLSPAAIAQDPEIVRGILGARKARSTGQRDKMLALAESAVARARMVQSHRLAEALIELGAAQTEDSKFDLARATFRDAALAAAEARDDSAIADAWLWFVEVSFSDNRIAPDVDAALFAARVATLRLAADDVLRPRYQFNAGSYHFLANNLDAAIDELAQAVTGWSASGPGHDPSKAALAEVHLGLAYGNRSDWVRSRAHLERGLAGLREQDNSQRALALAGLSRIAVEEDRFDEAERLSRQILALGEQEGDDNPRLGDYELNLAMTYLHWERCDRADAHLARAREILERVYGADSPDAAAAMIGQGTCALLRDDAAAAIALLRRARNISAAHPDYPTAKVDLASIDFMLARAVVRVGGDRAQAIAMAKQARATFASTGTTSQVAKIDSWLATNDRPHAGS